MRRSGAAILAIGLVVNGAILATPAARGAGSADTRGARLPSNYLAPNFRSHGPLIRLAAGAFDPLRDPPPPAPISLDERALDPRAPAYWLVQAEESPVAPLVRAIEESGGLLAGYLPERAFILRATPAQHAEIGTLSGVRWSGLYQPSWRLAPGLTSLEGPQVYEVSLFRDEPNPGGARRAISALPNTQLLPESSQYVLWVRGSRAELEDIASVVGVEWITLRPQLRWHNANARWVADTGVRDTYAATAPGRLNGSGQTIGVADLAVNYVPGPNGRVLEYFSDCSASGCKSADYVQAQSGFSEEQMFAIEPTGSSHRKLAAYFDLGGAGINGVDPSMHGAHVAGTATGDIGSRDTWEQADGIAPGARLVHQNLETPDGTLAGDPVLGPVDGYMLLQQAYRPRAPGDVPAEWTPADYAAYRPLEDARTHNNSYGGITPQVDPSDPEAPFAFDRFVWEHEDMVVVTAAGNAGDTGPGAIDSPSTAKNDLSSAASANGRIPMNSIDSLAFFSGRGPTADGRFGPTLATPGLSVVSAKGGSTDEAYALAGTSMSAPVLTGLATLVREYFYEGWGPAGGRGFGFGAPDSGRQHNPSAALVKATLVNGGERMRGWHTGDDGSDRTEDGKWPSFGQGYGRANLDNSLFFEGDDLNNWYHDVWRADAEAFSFPFPGPQARAYSLEVGESKPLDVSLAWTDAPNALAGGSPDLVNNLDLVVTAPDGQVFAGNNFNTETDPGADEEFTLPGAAAPDIDNVEERVRIPTPEPGTYEISVTAPELFDGPQGFALAASGALAGAAPERGPGLLPDEPGVPTISNIGVKGVSGDSAVITWRTNEPTTGRAIVSRGVSQQSFPDVYNLAEGGYQGLDEGVVKTSEEYANKLVVGRRHHALVTGLSPATTYDLTIEAVDGAGGPVVTSGPTFETGTAVFGAAPPDIGSLKEELEGGWKTASQIYVGRFKQELTSETDFGNALGAFMFRMPSALDPGRVTGAAVRLHSARDETNSYTDPTKYVVDLLNQSVEAEWGTQTYEAIHNAPALARLGPTVAERRGGGTEYSYYLSCTDIAQLRSTLSPDSEERRAAFRALPIDPPDISAFSFDFGFNEISAGPHLRPEIVLFLEKGRRQVDPLPCARKAPTPTISDVAVAAGEPPGTSVTVSWRTDVASDSTVLFRERKGGDWIQVGSPLRTTNHMVEIRNLDPFKDYVFAVRSRGCNGKQSVDDNAGAGYALREPLPAGALAPTFTFESGDQGWTTETDGELPADGWERRSPGYNSAFAWHLAPYQNETDERLVSPPLAHPGGPVSLRWRDQRGGSSSEELHIDWSVDGGEWNTAATFAGESEDSTAFLSRSVTFEAPEGQLRVRFRWVSASVISPLFNGVVIDNVTLLAAAADTPEPPASQAEGVRPESADLRNLSIPAPRDVPSEADMLHGTARCLPTMSPAPARRPRVRLLGPGRRPERGDAFRVRVHLGICNSRNYDLEGTKVYLRRRTGGPWKEIGAATLDDACRTHFVARANFRKARFRAIWPKQHPGLKRGRSRVAIIRTNRRSSGRGR